MLKFLSICSGIEAASVAFAPLGWEALAFAEIEPFPCAVLAHHYGASRPWHMPQGSPDLKKKENKARAAAIKAVSKIPVAGRIPNLGDLTRWREWPDALLVQVQLLCGGTPCQAFSVAGLRASLADDRGNLSLIFCELYAHINALRHAAGLPPALLLWENVPGVLSTHDNAFGCFLAGIAGEVDALQPPGGKWAHAGYVSGPSAAVAYRTLDAQYFGLAQRRKRVFVVASADPAFDPAAVLFEFTGLRRDTPPRRETGQTTAPTLSARAKGGGGLGTDADADCDGACIPEISQSQELAGTLRSTDGGSDVEHARANHIVATAAKAIPEICAPLTTNYHADNESQESKLIPHLANCLTRRMDKGPNTTLDEGQTLLVDVTHSLRAEDLAPVLQSHNPTAVCTPEPFAFDLRGREGGAMPEGPHATAAMRASSGGSGGSSRSYIASPATAHVAQHFNAYQRTVGDVASPIMAGDSKKTEIGVLDTLWRVRRLTPEECELLQGFPLGYTLLHAKGGRLRKDTDLAQTIAYLIDLGMDELTATQCAHSPDGPRYKALGNSWAVPCARWIAHRIAAHLAQ